MRTASSATGATVLSSPWAVLRDNRRYVFAGLGFFVLFLVLLSHAPRLNSFYGSVDTLFVPALGNTVANRIISALSGEFVGQSMYPADILRYGETAFGTGAIFLAFHFLGASDVMALYLTQVLLLTLMALATMILAERLTRSFPAAILAAFIFTTSNFVWADVDHLPIHFYFFPLLSLSYFIKATEEGSGRDLVIAGALGGLQAYYSVQVFAYQCMLLGIFGLFQLRGLAQLASKWKGLAAICYLAVALPLLVFYLNTALRLSPADAWPRSAHEQIYSLQPSDLVRHLPGKLIEFPFAQESAGGWTQVAHSAFPGLVVPLLAVLGLKSMNSRKAGLVAVGLLALFFSLGTSIEFGDVVLPSPLVWFYESIPLANYLRVGIRAYSLVLLSLSMLAAFGWRRLSEWLGVRGRRMTQIGLPLVCALIASENVSLPVNAFELLPYPRVPPAYVEYFQDKPNALILDLPSQSTRWPYYIDDIVYTLWQTSHKRNILGGVNGYYPQSRIATQKQTDKLPAARAFRYFRDAGATHFVWHRSPFLVCRLPHSDLGCDPETGRRDSTEARGPDWLDETQYLQLVFEDEDVRIYELK